MIRRYDISIRENATRREWSRISVIPEYLLDFLHPYYQYTVTVAAYTIDIGPPSAPVEFITDEDSKGLLSNKNVYPHPFSLSLSLSLARSFTHSLTHSHTHTVPGTPVNLTVRAVDSQTVHMSWDPPQANQRNGIIQRYAVSITTLTGQQAVRSFQTTTTSYVVDSLHPYYDYSCAVAAETSAGRGTYVTRNVRLPEDGKNLHL